MTAQIIQFERPKAPEGFLPVVSDSGKTWFEAEAGVTDVTPAKTYRKQMHEDWRKAMLHVEFCEAYLTLHRVCERAITRGWCDQAARVGKLNSFLPYNAPSGDKGIHSLELVEYLRFSIASAFRVPAPTQAEIKWKRRQLKDLRSNGHISVADAAFYIRRDECWHRDNPAPQNKRWRKR